MIESIHFVNLILLILNLLALSSLLLAVVFYNIFYHKLDVPIINSGHDVINTKSIDSLLYEFKKVYNLEEYEVNYSIQHKRIKLFKNHNKRKKQITISKHIFPSVGYELDYLIGRIWMSAKLISKDTNVIVYRATLTFLPAILIALAVICFFIHSFIFFVSMHLEENSGDISNFAVSHPVLKWFISNPIFAFISMGSIAVLILNYFIAMRLKENIEIEFNQEVNAVVKLTMQEYYQDFVAARTYALNINNPYLPLVHKGDDEMIKWLGPFVKM